MSKKDKEQCEDLLLRLLKFDTQNFDNKPSGYTVELLRYVKNRLEKKGIRCRLQPYKVTAKIGNKYSYLRNRANLIAWIKKPRKPYLLLQGHVDTVPFNSKEWKYNPLGEKKGDLIFGRGATDMKGSVASMILALEDLAKAKELTYSPLLLLTSDEEANNFAGIRHFISNNREKILFAFSCEPTNFVIVNRSYGAMYLIFKTYGEKIKRDFSDQKNAIENMFQVLKRIEPYKKKVLQMSDKKLGKTMMNIGKIDGGVKVNQFPTECSLELAIRNTLPCNKYLSLLKREVLNKGDSFCKLEIVFKHNPSIFKIPDKVKRKLELSLKKENIPVNYGVQKYITEATIMHSFGMPSTIFGPGDDISNHHKADERVKINEIIKARRVYRNLFL